MRKSIIPAACWVLALTLATEVGIAGALQSAQSNNTPNGFELRKGSLYLAIKCKSNQVYDKKKKKCVPSPAALGAKYFKTTCALSGCHAGQGTTRFAGLTSVQIKAAISNVPQMGALNPSAKDLKNLVAYLKTVK